MIEPDRYRYRWVCEPCRAIHYHKVIRCSRCYGWTLHRLENTQQIIDELANGTRKLVAFEPGDVEREPLKKSKAPKKPKPSDDTDDLINDILGG